MDKLTTMLWLVGGAGLVTVLMFAPDWLARWRAERDRVEVLLAITASGDLLTLREDMLTWKLTGLPWRRKVALIHAGIGPESAHDPAVVALSEDELAVMRGLRTLRTSA